MSRIKGKGNKDTEMVMIQILRKNRISGWRRNQTVLGKPDFIFPKKKVALFVDGCFWHSCPKHSNTPKNNQEFWLEKLQKNKNIDKFVTHELRKLGWKVIRVWEHELAYPDHVAKRILNIL